MDAVKFLQERNRMYESGAATPGIGLEDDYNPVSAVEVVEKWAAAHPRKTRQSVFLEQYPNCMTDDDGIVGMCPRNVDKTYDCDLRRLGGRADFRCDMRRLGGCADCRREFWMQEAK